MRRRGRTQTLVQKNRDYTLRRQSYRRRWWHYSSQSVKLLLDGDTAAVVIYPPRRPAGSKLPQIKEFDQILGLYDMLSNTNMLMPWPLR